jgi:hypothetical protein
VFTRKEIEQRIIDDMSKVKFVSYTFGFDSGYYTKIGKSIDGELYVLDCDKLPDEHLAKALDGKVIRINA